MHLQHCPHLPDHVVWIFCRFLCTALSRSWTALWAGSSSSFTSPATPRPGPSSPSSPPSFAGKRISEPETNMTDKKTLNTFLIFDFCFYHYRYCNNGYYWTYILCNRNKKMTVIKYIKMCVTCLIENCEGIYQISKAKSSLQWFMYVYKTPLNQQNQERKTIAWEGKRERKKKFVKTFFLFLLFGFFLSLRTFHFENSML